MIKRVYSNNNSKIINYKNYSIDTNKRQVIENNKEINLTTLEYDLLLLFLNNKSKCIKKIINWCTKSEIDCQQ